MKTWILMRMWPALVAVLGWFGSEFSEPVRAWVTANPDLAGFLVTLLVTVANMLKSPRES